MRAAARRALARSAGTLRQRLTAGYSRPGGRWRRAVLAVAAAVVAAWAGYVLPMAWVRDEMMLIPYAGPTGRFPRVSYIDVLNGSFPHGVFKDRIVLVGATATALGNMLMVPFDRQHRMMSGVELQANIADALLQGIVLRPSADAWSAAFAAAAAVLHALLYS